MRPDTDTGTASRDGGRRGTSPRTASTPGGTSPGTDPVPAGDTIRPAARVPSDAGLRRRYEAYCRRQGAELLSLVPRSGIRPLYRAARERAERGGWGEEPSEDAVGMLAEFCAELLPLPPFEVWRADFNAHRAAHLEEAGDWTPGSAAEPVTIEIRRFADPGGRTWYASLDVRRSAGAWRGSVAFHTEGETRIFRTGEVFREADATAVRSRFLEFDAATLQAFLRSVLP